MDINIRNMKRVSVFLRLHVLSNTQTIFEDQFMKKFSNTEAELKISVAYKKAVHLCKYLLYLKNYMALKVPQSFKFP